MLLIVRPRRHNINFKELALQNKRLAITRQRVRFWEKLRYILERTIRRSGGNWRLFLCCCGAAAAAGFLLGLFFFGTLVLSAALAVAAVPIPYLVFYLAASRARRAEFDRLESAMSMITNAYAGHFNILAAIEHYTQEQNKGVPAALRVRTPFDAFVSNATIVGYSMEKSLMILDLQVGNAYFTNWIKTLRLCAQNRGMLFALHPIIQSMSDHKNMQAEADSRAESAWRNYLTVVAIAMGLTPMLRILNADWYAILTQTVWGNLLLILLLASCMISAFFVAKISRS